MAWHITAWLGWTRASRLALANLLPDEAPVLLKVAQPGAEAALQREYENGRVTCSRMALQAVQSRW
jgi:hypothetical protein